MKPIVRWTLDPAIDASCVARGGGPIHKIRTWGERYHPGGGRLNAARVIRDLGGEALAIYCAGRGHRPCAGRVGRSRLGRGSGLGRAGRTGRWFRVVIGRDQGGRAQGAA